MEVDALVTTDGESDPVGAVESKRRRSVVELEAHRASLLKDSDTGDAAGPQLKEIEREMAMALLDESVSPKTSPRARDNGKGGIAVPLEQSVDVAGSDRVSSDVGVEDDDKKTNAAVTASPEHDTGDSYNDGAVHEDDISSPDRDIKHDESAGTASEPAAPITLEDQPAHTGPSLPTEPESELIKESKITDDTVDTALPMPKAFPENPAPTEPTEPAEPMQTIQSAPPTTTEEVKAEQKATKPKKKSTSSGKSITKNAKNGSKSSKGTTGKEHRMKASPGKKRALKTQKKVPRKRSGQLSKARKPISKGTTSASKSKSKITPSASRAKPKKSSTSSPRPRTKSPPKSRKSPSKKTPTKKTANRARVPAAVRKIESKGKRTRPTKGKDSKGKDPVSALTRADIEKIVDERIEAVIARKVRNMNEKHMLGLNRTSRAD